MHALTDNDFLSTRVSLRLAVSCALSVSATGIANAAEWSAAPVMSWGVDQDSNRVLADEARASQSGNLHLEAQLRHTSPNLQLSVRPLVEFHRYTNDGSANSDDRSLGLASNWIREHWQWSVSAQVAQESTLTSELTDTGVIEGDSTRRTKSAASSWRLEHTELRSTDIQAAYADVDYQGRLANRLPGYRYPSLSLSERFQVSERSAFVMSAFASELQSPFRLSESRDTGFTFAVDHALSDLTQLHFAFGGSERKIAGIRSNGYVGELDLTRNSEAGQWRLFYHRKLAASGLGYLVERDEAGLSLRHPLSPLMSGSVSVQAVRNDNATFGGSSERHRYEAFETGLDWRLRETAMMGLRLGARRAQRFENTDLAGGWRASVVFTWTPRPQTLSR